MSARYFLFYLFSISFLFASGCDRKTDVAVASQNAVLLVGNAAEPRSLDLQLVTGVPENKIISALFEGLIGNHPSKDDVMVPGVATHWEHNKDMTEWVFHLRPDATWSDGTPLGAEDFIFSYHRMLNPLFAAAYAPMLHSIRHAEAYNRDQRVYILCGLDNEFLIKWDVLKRLNCEGNGNKIKAELKIVEPSKLTKGDLKILLNHLGLDRMGRNHLMLLMNDLSLFDWPESFDKASQQLVIERLIQYIDQGEYDLFERAQLGIKAIDSHTLLIQLREPVPYLPSMVRHNTWYPVPKHVITKFGKIHDRFSDWSKKDHLIGNGPFKIKDWKYNHYIEVDKNPNYWDRSHVGLNGIKFFPIENPYTETRAFLSGQLHTTYNLPAELLISTQKKYPQYIKTEPYVGTVFLRLNTQNKTLNHPLIRKAISLSLNRKELCEFVYEGYKPASSFCPRMGSYQAADILEFDIERAKSLLSQAGFPNGKGLPSLALLTARPHPAADAIQASLRKIGIRLTIEQKDWGSYVAAQQSYQYDMALSAWIGDYMDPTTFLDMWKKDNGNNNTGWSSLEYEKCLTSASHSSLQDARFLFFAKSESILLDELPIVPIAWMSRIYLHHPMVTGWNPLILDNHPWKNISLKDKE